MWQMQRELFYIVKVLLSRCCLRKCLGPVMINHNQLNFLSPLLSPSKLVSLSLYVDFYARSILWKKMFFWLVTSVKQRKNSESPWGIKPQTFGFHNLMLYHWATETLWWARPIVKSYMFIYKIIQIVCTLWLAIKPFYMSLCKHGFRSSFIGYFIKEM